MKFTAQIVGLAAVATFLLSYQQKKRKNIIALNAVSRALYIIQYIMLGAFEGAVLDILGILSSVAAQNKNKAYIKNHVKLFFILMNMIIVVAGILTYKNIFSLFPVLGVLLHTSAFWITEEKTIHRVSFAGSSFWMIYNVSSLAYGSAIGDFLTMISIGTAIYRYDIRKSKVIKNEEE